MVPSIEAFTFSYAQTAKYLEEKKMAQGASALSALYQIPQSSMVCRTTMHLLQLMPATGAVCTALKVLSYIPTLCLFWCPLTAILKADLCKPAKESYVAGALYQVMRKISIVSVDHLGTLFQLALVVSALGLCCVAQLIPGSCLLLGCCYHYLDLKGHIHHKVSLFVARYFPFITATLFFLAIPSIIGAAVLLTSGYELAQSYSAFLVFKEKIKKKFLTKFFPHRDQPYGMGTIDQPISERVLTKEHINTILGSRSSDFVINPAALAKEVYPSSSLEQDLDFSYFLTVFDTIQWEKKESLIAKKLAFDDRFIEQLLVLFPAASIETIQTDFMIYFERWKQATSKTAAIYLKEQLHYLIGVLKQEGDKELKPTVDNLSKVLPLFKQAVKDKQHIAVEDAILKLSVEGGGYCASGLKRMSSELLLQFLQSSDRVAGDKVACFPFRLKAHLQMIRQKIIDNFYRSNLLLFSMSNQSQKLAADSFAYDSCIFLNAGFVPLEQETMQRFNIIQHTMLLFIGEEKKLFVTCYRKSIVSAIDELGLENVKAYMASWVEANIYLNPEEKSSLNAHLAEPKTKVSLYNLMLYQLGIFDLKSGS